VEYFLEKFNHQYNKSYQRLSESTLQRFYQYDWPGNVRELENIVKRIVVLDNEDVVLAKSTPPDDSPYGGSPSPQPRPVAVASSAVSAPTSGYSLKSVGKEAASQAEKDLIRNILYQTHWNRKRAAELLQISYKALLYKIKKYDLNNDG
jgi:transcriptional regulator with PAS, ATPase and Fis domain